MKILSDKTLIPLGLAVSVIGGGTVWLTKVHLTQEAHGQSLQQIEDSMTDDRKIIWAELKSFRVILQNLDQRLSGIEGELRRIRN